MKCEKGFALIELLVVVAIIGVISSMAIIQYRNYKLRALDARALGSLRRLIEAQENYFISNEAFALSTNDINNWTDDENISTQISTSDGNSWSGYSYHNGGSYRYCFNTSSKSGIFSILGIATACP